MWAHFIVFSPQEGMMHIIICSSRAFVWAPEETKENTGQKSRSVPCGESKTRLGVFYVQLSFTLRMTFRRRFTTSFSTFC